MTRPIRPFLCLRYIGLLSACLISAACGQNRSSTFDSNSNWLMHCESDNACDDGYTCAGQRCMPTCDADSACPGEAPVCQSLEESNSCLAPAPGQGVCFVSCSADTECSGLSTGLSCVDGVCLQQSASCELSNSASPTGPSDAGDGSLATQSDASTLSNDSLSEAGSDEQNTDAAIDTESSSPSEADAAMSVSSETDAAQYAINDASGAVSDPVDAAVGNGQLLDASTIQYVAGITNGIDCCDYYGVIKADLVNDFCVFAEVVEPIGEPLAVEGVRAARPAAACEVYGQINSDSIIEGNVLSGMISASYVGQRRALTVDLSVGFDANNPLGIPETVDLYYQDLVADWEWSSGQR